MSTVNVYYSKIKTFRKNIKQAFCPHKQYNYMSFKL